jgi:hypothetical protein
MRSTNMEFDDAFEHVIAEIGDDWDKRKSNLGARNRESKNQAKYKARQELVTHWQSEMTAEERESLQPERVKNAPSQDLLNARAAKELAIQHLFEQVSLKERRFKSGEQWEVLRRKEGTVIVGKDGAEKQLPLDQTRKFSAFEREKIKLSIGDRIRFAKNV